MSMFKSNHFEFIGFIEFIEFIEFFEFSEFTPLSDLSCFSVTLTDFITGLTNQKEYYCLPVKDHY